MEFSRYNIYVDGFRGKPQYLVFNALTGGTVVLPSGPNGPDLKSLSPQDIAKLFDMLILVPPSLSQREIAEYYMYKNRYAHRDVVATVFTTRRCNLACTYCYERESEANVPTGDMTEGTARGVVDWLIRYSEARNSNALHLQFYGGEPLVNSACIAQIGQSLAEYCARHNIRFYTYMITNATLLDNAAVEVLRKLNLTQVQITLDGPARVHDTRRRTSGGAGSFNATMLGLRNVAAIASVCIRVNVDHDNIDYVRELLDYLNSEGLATRRNVFYVSNVYDCDAGVCRINPLAWSATIPEIIKEARTLGFRARNPFKLSPCFGVREGSFTFDVDGSVYTCTQLAEYPNTRIGHIGIARFEAPYYDLLLSRPSEDQCYECPYFPLCLGGCRAAAVRRSGDLLSRICGKQGYDEVIPATLRAIYE